MIQKYDFVTGIEGADAPTTGAPSAPSDVFVLGNYTEFTIANNVSAQNVTSAVWDKTVYRMVIINYVIFRSASGGQTRSQVGQLLLIHDGTTWVVVPTPYASDAGLTFDIDTSTGQLKYTSDDNGGSYNAANSVLYWKVFDLAEV